MRRMGSTRQARMGVVLAMANGGSNNSSNGAGSQGQPAAQSQPHADGRRAAAGHRGTSRASLWWSARLGRSRTAHSGGLRNVKNYPHFQPGLQVSTPSLPLHSGSLGGRDAQHDKSISGCRPLGTGNDYNMHAINQFLSCILLTDCSSVELLSFPASQHSRGEVVR